jgi:hypothetical protein
LRVDGGIERAVGRVMRKKELILKGIQGRIT